jgi:predicted peptidase
MKPFILLILVFALFFLGFCFSGCKKSSGNGITEPVTYRILEAKIDVAGVSMDYFIGVPSTYSPGDAPPLILALHYGGEVVFTMGKVFMESLIEPALRNLEAIIVSPNCPGQGWTDPVSEEAVLAMLGQVMAEYNVDAGKILVTGYSLGGIGTWHLAAKYPDIFACALPISAMPTQEAVDTISGIPLYVIHSRVDQVFPIQELEAVVALLQNRGLSIQFKIIEGVSHYDTAAFVQPLQQARAWIQEHWGL